MKLQKITVLALISAAVLSACGRQDVPPGAWSGGTPKVTAAAETEAASGEASAEENADAVKENASNEAAAAGTKAAEEAAAGAAAAAGETAAEESAAANAQDEADGGGYADGYAVYQDMDGVVFGFLSGVGAWETTLEVEGDGSFRGQFHDMNMGETGEGYSHGTLYECAFTGHFSEAQKEDGLCWTAGVADLQYETEKDGSDRYIDDEEILHIMTEPYGLREGDSIRILLPGTPWDSLSEGFLNWTIWRITEGEPLPEIAIYNETAETVFYPDHYAADDVVAESAPKAAEGVEEETGSFVYREALNAYASQQMPDYFIMPFVPYDGFTPAKPYQSVTEAMLQGRWVNRYTEGGEEIEEILTVTGDRGRIECYRGGVPVSAWNGEGLISIEDRSDRHLCPAFRISEEDGENICTIYIRWVRDDAFFDGGFLNEWKRETTEDPADMFRYDTVSLDSLQGLWYSEYMDGGGLYMTLLNIDGSRGWIFETVDGKISEVWNGEGPVSLVMENLMGDIWYPELLLGRETGPAAGGTAGIYITDVEEDRFYDAGLNRWYVRIDPDYGADFDYYYEPSLQMFDDGSAAITGGNYYIVRPAGKLDADGGCLSWTVDVTTDSGLTQTISHELYPDTIYTPAADGVVSEGDVNFDGRPDILLYLGTLGAGGVQYYDCYLNQGDSLVYCEGFREIPDPVLDDASRQIGGHIRDGAAAYYELSYTIRGSSVQLIDEIRFEYDEELQDYVPRP